LILYRRLGSAAQFLPQALRNIEPELQKLSGKTVIFIFTDGTSDFAGKTKDPEDYTQAFADKYNVCFYMIGDATDKRSEKRLTDMAKANACSRVIPFKRFVDNPNYITGALYILLNGLQVPRKETGSNRTRLRLVHYTASIQSATALLR
jgi:OOP family OmpA-OmpF porin